MKIFNANIKEPIHFRIEAGALIVWTGENSGYLDEKVLKPRQQMEMNLEVTASLDDNDDQE